MIKIDAQGRLAAQPEVVQVGQYVKCEFTVMANRFSKGAEVTESARFILWGEEAERFAQRVIKGQFVSVTGTQETSVYERDGKEARSVRYRVTWWHAGPKPAAARQDGQGYASRQNGAGNDGGGYGAPRAEHPASQPRRYQAQQRPQQPQDRDHDDHGGGYDDSASSPSESGFM